jgi:hypothetical protein
MQCNPSHGSLCAEGRGSLLDAHTVKVELSAGGTKVLRAKHILLAVGGKPVKAPIPGAVRMPARSLACCLCSLQNYTRPSMRSSCTVIPFRA